MGLWSVGKDAYRSAKRTARRTRVRFPLAPMYNFLVLGHYPRAQWITYADLEGEVTSRHLTWREDHIAMLSLTIPSLVHIITK